MFIYFAMLSDDKDTFTSLLQQLLWFGSLSDSESESENDTAARAAAPSADLFRLRVGVGNKRQQRACSCLSHPSSRRVCNKHLTQRACSSSCASLFRLRSRSPKIKDTTERTAAPSPAFSDSEVGVRIKTPQSVQQLLRQTFSDSEVGVRK